MGFVVSGPNNTPDVDKFTKVIIEYNYHLESYRLSSSLSLDSNKLPPIITRLTDGLTEMSKPTDS